MNAGTTPEARAAARAHWAKRGPLWDRTSVEGFSTSDGYNQILIDAAGAAPGQIVLDIASGAGEPAISLARHIGPGGVVIASDLSPEMLAGARRRVAATGLGNIRFAVADMAELPWRDATFDAVTCRFGIMFPADPVPAVAEARRVLKPGARAAYMAWGPMEANTAYITVRRTVLAFFGEDPDAPVSRHRFGPPGTLAQVLEAAGFSDVEERDLIESAERPADPGIWHERMQRNFAFYLDRLDESGKARLEDALARAFEPLRDGDVYRLATHAKLGVGVA